MTASLFGSVAIWAAVAASTASIFSPPRLSRRLLVATASLAVAAVVVLGAAMLGDDFSLRYVAETSSRATPWPYKISAVWGGMDGSMLLYACLTSVVSVLGLRRARPTALKVAAAVATLLLAFTAVFANPFETLALPAVDGEGLLAILQHPAMIYHPPLLYLGLTSLVVPFAITAGAVIGGDTGRTWIDSVKRPAFLSWSLLTLGMVAGANWAYIELGWGGFWAWDPVENTALMPWLALTALIHGLRVQRRDGRLARWNVLFALIPFALSVMGVYLTRSGVTGSIHSFAEDPVIGRILLGAAGIVALVAVIAALRSPRGTPWQRVGVARDTWLAVSVGLVTVILVFVTVGTAYPAYAQVFGGRSVNVDAGFFVITVLPLVIVIATLLGFALSTHWDGVGVGRSEVIAFSIVAVVIAALVGLVIEAPPLGALALLAPAVAAVVALGSAIVVRRPDRAEIAAYVAHLGMAMVLLGAAASAFGAEHSGSMRIGDEIEVGGHIIRLENIETGESERYIYVRGVVAVDGVELGPEIRAYEDQPVPVAEPEMRSNLTGDVIVAISRLESDASTVDVNVFVRPMVWWVWLGALTLTIAGLIALGGRSVASAKRRRRARAERRAVGTTSDTWSR